MPIYEYYCPDNHTIYQFYAKTLAQGKLIPKCPANSAYRMEKMLSSFAVTSGGKADAHDGHVVKDKPGEDVRMEAAMNAMESEFSNVDENDPRAMARMMRRMAELTGEKIDGEMEEVVRKLEEGTDPDTLEDQMGGGPADDAGEPGEAAADSDAAAAERRQRFRVRRAGPARDPQLYDYE